MLWGGGSTDSPVDTVDSLILQAKQSLMEDEGVDPSIAKSLVNDGDVSSTTNGSQPHCTAFEENVEQGL